MQESFGADPMAEAAGSGRGQHRLVLVLVRRSRERRLTGA
jgi:hypothetical protein